jgi:N-methylhydantoinase B
MSLEGDGSVHPPPGLFGGSDGTPGRVEINHRGEKGVEVPSKFPYRATQAGDRLLLVAPSGGGYGPAAERDTAAIREDIADGVLSGERARELYGFEE